MPKAVVIGSGIAGLACALRLGKMGFDVNVFEANAYPGGKIHNLTLDGYRFDTGPSLFTMPHLVDELFELYGEDPKDHFDYIQKDKICNYFWEDGTRFSAYADRSVFIESALKTFDVTAKELEKYLEKSKMKYDLTAPVFLEKSLHKSQTYLSLETIKSFFLAHNLDITKSLHETNTKSFKDRKLVQFFDRYATYNGSSPYKTPGIMSMIPHLEMHYGTYLPKGGMRAITDSLYRFAVSQGINFHFEESVEKILHDQKNVNGIRTCHGEYPADLVISNADVFTSYKNMLQDLTPPNKLLHRERSSSALIFYWGIKKSFPELDLHNVIFGGNYEHEFRQIFEHKTIGEDPTVYINITSKEEYQDAPKDCENWFVMVNAPGNFDQDWDTLITQTRKNIQHKINTVLNTDIARHIEVESILDPKTIESGTKSHRGALYGASSNSRFAAFLRHPNFASKVRGLYFCGGSVHPGGGIPLCLLSAKIVSELVETAYYEYNTCQKI